MKKILIFTLFLIVFFTFGFSSISAKEINTGIDKFSPDKDVIKETVNNKDKDDKILKDDSAMMMALGLCPDMDAYESNDDFAYAKKVTDSYLYGTLHDMPWYCSFGVVDEADYYYYTSTREKDITVELRSIPSGTDYDIKFYDEQGNFLKGSYRAGNTDELLSYTIEPGTYYVKIYSYSGYNNDDTYLLDIDSTAVYSQGLSVTSTIKTDNIGALWTSQYFPRGIDPNTYSGGAVDGIFSSHTSISPHAFGMKMLEEQGLLDTYISRILFLWDSNAKIQVANDLKEISDLYIQEYINTENEGKEVSFVVNSVANGVAVIALICDSKTLGVVSVSMALIDMIIPTQSDVSGVEHYGYVRYLEGFLRGNAYTGDIVKITELYQIYTVNHTNPGSYGGGVTFHVKFFLDISTEDIFESGTYLSYYRNGNPFYGSYELIKDTDELNNIISFD